MTLNGGSIVDAVNNGGGFRLSFLSDSDAVYFTVVSLEDQLGVSGVIVVFELDGGRQQGVAELLGYNSGSDAIRNTDNYGLTFLKFLREV